MYMNAETEALHNRLQAAGVTTHDLLFKQFPADLLLEAIASRFIDDHAYDGYHLRKNVFGWVIHYSSNDRDHRQGQGNTRLEALVLACEKLGL